MSMIEYHVPRTAFDALRRLCGLSMPETADYLDVRVDTVEKICAGKSWHSPGLAKELAALHQRQHDEAGRILSEAAPGEILQLEMSSTNDEAIELGWGSVGGHFVVAALVALKWEWRIEIVAR